MDGNDDQTMPSGTSGIAEEPAASPRQSSSSGLNSTKKRFLDSLRHITSKLSDDIDEIDDFALELSQRFRKQSRTQPGSRTNDTKRGSRPSTKGQLKKRGPKTSSYKCRLTCLSDPTMTSIRNLHRVLLQLNSSGLGIAPHERSNQEFANRRSSSLPLVWTSERLKSFIIDTFPPLETIPEGYDLMYADSSKTLHLIPPEINTPDALKNYATGRSAIYIRPKNPISLAGSSSTSNVGADHTAASTTSALSNGSSHQEQSTSTTTTSILPQLDVVVMTDESYTIPIICTICENSLLHDIGEAIPCGHLFHHSCISEWHKHTKAYNNDVAQVSFGNGPAPDGNQISQIKTKCPECAQEIDEVTQSNIMSMHAVTSESTVDYQPEPVQSPPSLTHDEFPSFSEAMRNEETLPSIYCDVYVPDSLLQLKNTIKGKRYITVRRQTILTDLIRVYEDPNVSESEIEMQVVNEDALDFGGVTRDVFSSFWDELFNDTELFSGTDSKVPIFNASNAASAMKILPIVGRIFSHSYLVTGCFPTYISLVSVITMFLGGSVPIDDEILINCLYEYFPGPEREFIQRALSLSSFDEPTLNRLIDIYSTNGLTRIPTPANLRTDVLYLATFLLRLQPQICFSTILSGMNESQKSIWSSLQVKDFVQIYAEQSLSAEKLIDALEPDNSVLNTDQERVYYFLKTFIREATPDHLKRLVRFITGSSNLLVSRITITFHSAKQFPKAMTCSHTLILSSFYQTYSSFRNDFLSILQNEDSFLMLCA